jgi:hypothetical protein
LDSCFIMSLIFFRDLLACIFFLFSLPSFILIWFISLFCGLPNVFIKLFSNGLRDYTMDHLPLKGFINWFCCFLNEFSDWLNELAHYFIVLRNIIINKFFQIYKNLKIKHNTFHSFPSKRVPLYLCYNIVLNIIPKKGYE